MEGYQRQTASNGAEVLIAIRNEAPDLVLLDLMMPKMDGLTMLSELRDEGCKDIPVILLTGVPEGTILKKPGSCPSGRFSPRPISRSRSFFAASRRAWLQTIRTRLNERCLSIQAF